MAAGSGEVSAGQTIILGTDYARKQAISVIESAPPYCVVNVRLPGRTIAQNDKMQAMLSDVSRQKPEGRNMPPHKWKGVFMDAIGCKPEWIPSLDGESIVCTGYRSSRLTKAQMSDLIEQMYEYGARHGVAWSEGN